MLSPCTGDPPTNRLLPRGNEGQPCCWPGKPHSILSRVTAPSLKELAEAAKLSLQVGVLELAVVRRCADRIIETQKEPPEWLIDLALENDKYRAMDLLATVPGEIDRTLVKSLWFAQICRSCQRHALTPRQFADELWRVYLASISDHDTRAELATPYLCYEEFDTKQCQSNDKELVRKWGRGAVESVEEFQNKYAPFADILAEHFPD